MKIGDHDLHFHVDGSGSILDSAFHFSFPQVKNESIFDFGGQKSKVDSKIKKAGSEKFAHLNIYGLM